MISTRPYLLRAFYEWINHNHCTPYMVIDADRPGVSVPQEYVDDGRIVLNVSPLAVRDFVISNASIEFNAKFGGIPTHVSAPIAAVVAIYAHENGRGMVFSEEDAMDDGEEGAAAPPAAGSKDGKPKLTLVK